MSMKTGKLNAATKVDASMAEILASNAEDLARLPSSTTAAFRDRLTLTSERIRGMTESLRQVANLPDPVGEVVEQRTLPNGLLTRRVRAPLGTILMIFESRPNVILEAFSLAFKSGNAIALRGGSDSRSTAETLFGVMNETLAESNIDPNVYLGLNDYDRALVEQLLKRPDLIDIVVPRGGEKLIAFVQETALMPIIKNDRGLCHAFIHHDADLDMAVSVVINAKTQRPGVCNSLETVLVHSKIASAFFTQLAAAAKSDLKFHCDDEALQALGGHAQATVASEQDWDTEYLDLILNCRVVSSLDAALAHIEKHGSKHSETIITRSEPEARRFQNEVDAAAVYWNASTRFTDGFEFGLGGELGISTQKLHVRGPVGLRELTSLRWIIDGTGQIRS
jgi:glutamate-5-semialdehyde dehydrogenase